MAEASIKFGPGISHAWSNVAAFVPKFVVFLIILIVGYLVAKAICKVFSRVLSRVGFDRVVERGGVKRALARSQYDASDILARLVFYAIMLFVLSTAFGVFGRNPISAYLHAVIAYLPLVFVAVIIVVVAAAIAAGTKRLLEGTLGGLSYARILANLAAGFILALGIIAALDQLHIAANVVNAILYAGLAALAGIAIVAVGGGGIRTMSQRWEVIAERYDEEKARIAAAAASSPSMSDQVRQYAGQAQQSVSGNNRGSSSKATAPGPESTRPYGQP
jgi:hypothetical protein